MPSPFFTVSRGARIAAGIILAAHTAVAPALALEAITNQVFQVGPGGTLVINADRGSIEVSSAEANTVELTVIREVKRTSDAKAREILEAHRLTWSQNGDTVSVKAEGPSRSWNLRGPELSVRYQVTVPKRFNLDLDTRGGSISVGDLEGALALETAGGSIAVGKIDGKVDADTSGGSIKIASATGPVVVETSGGSIDLGTMNSVQADTSGGSIRVRSASGPVEAETSGGSIDLGEVSGPVQAETSGGSITARFRQAPKGDSHLETSGGGVTVYIAESAGFDLDAACSGGRVTSDLAVATQGKAEKSALRGQLGNGGPKLVLRTSGGGIRVKQLADATR